MRRRALLVAVVWSQRATWTLSSERAVSPREIENLSFQRPGHHHRGHPSKSSSLDARNQLGRFVIR
jgi:hypothetical protein